ncbi:GNAT family N-acetyltransferase [Methanobrevibacter arboriphilus]|uniref:GNAT family N-acetyltransferase n=1 Tax=Methanobrevibacter arboriphilus TaxID=39441 RepID=UPI001CDA8243|nr:GNAT family N-acetyltransferase [Methanobrevibacter arboriphilus]
MNFQILTLKKDAENFINIASKEKFMKVFAIEVDNEAVGSIALNFSQINDKNNYNNYENIETAELGYWLAEKHWNKGIITLAIKDIVEYGFNDYEINCIYATPFKDNIASQKVLKKSRF